MNEEYETQCIQCIKMDNTESATLPQVTKEANKDTQASSIEGLRGWAVLVVVISHFFPYYLPQGELGVDVLFVLSGFLIAVVLHEKPFVFNTYKKFYFRRIRRLFPLLLLDVLLVTIYCSLRFAGARLYNQTRSALYALSFSTNIKQSNEETPYFKEVMSSEDFLIHTWPIAVEVQFSVIAPFIILAGKKLTGGIGHSFLAYLLVVAGSSFSFHVVSKPSIAFYTVFARLWQFIFGAFAFNLLVMAKQGNSENGSVLIYKVLWWIIIICATVFSIFEYCDSVFTQEILSRFLLTAVSGGAVYINMMSYLLCNEFITMLGNCSYSLYLHHWIAACILKEYSVDTIYGKVLTIALCIFLSHYSYYYYERWYVKLCHNDTLLLIGALYLANLLAVVTVLLKLGHPNPLA